MSILVTTTKTGTFKANARPRCSRTKHECQYFILGLNPVIIREKGIVVLQTAAGS